MEISLSIIRVSDFSPTANDELMTKQLDLLEEHREMATIWLVNYQQKMAQMYDKGVRSREFSVEDLVLHRALGSARDLSNGKLALNWEESYRVTVITGVGAYYLEDLKERPLQRLWNVQYLKRYYH